MRVRPTTGLAVLLLLAACGQGRGEPAAVPTTEQVTCVGGSYVPAEEGAVVPRDEACPEEATSPPASPSAATGSPGAWDLAAALLSPETAAAVEEPGWSVTEPYEPEAGPVLDPCGDEQFPRSGAIAASTERELGSTREAGGSDLVQEVFRYTSALEAADAFAGYAEAVERCPATPDPAADGLDVRHDVVAEDEADGVRRLLVQRRPCVGPDQCPPLYASYYLVAQAGDGLTAASYARGEDGDPADAARAMLEAIADQLDRAVRG